ncbi:hypothetical protein EWM64_g7830 [Hericium alpestre]|uniref:Uncharacterized protein n=1 Tax=Hericium alpestre TaxID=135208 RepID=A0A4Y9ZN19_9AGAM|nr:hypothetical protein EWM64_g7830 [Hericium alpestre]
MSSHAYSLAIAGNPHYAANDAPPMEVLLFTGGIILAILGLSFAVVWVMLKVYG